jgi:RNA exonuclease 1
MKGVKPIKAERSENKNTPITEYLATIEDLQENEYPLHPAFGSTDSAKDVLLACRKKYHQTTDDGWVESRVNSLEDGDVPEQDIENGDVTAGRKILAVDCEMVKTANNPLTLARVSVVDWDGNVVLDELVKPEQPVTDYVTFYSGITEQMLEPVTTTIGDIQKRLLEIVTPQTILIGHSLESDLKALKFVHPFIIDTVLQYPHPRGPPLKSGLSFLAEKYLGKKMKRDRAEGGHDSIEDARAALELIKLKCWKGPSFGTREGNGESIFKRLRRTPRLKPANSDADAKEFKAGAVVDWGDPSRGHGAAANIVITCESDAEVVEGIKRAVASGDVSQADAESASPSEPVDFVWARFRELEAIRGWWSSSSPGDTEEHRQNVFARYSATDPTKDPTAPTPEVLAKAIKQVAANVAEVYAALSPCTAFIVYSGSGDMREVFRLGDIQRQFRREYATKKWEELSVRWTDDESQALRSAVKKAREGVGFVVVK